MARDGKLVGDVPPYRRIANILFRTRNESVVYFEEAVDVTDTLPWIERWNSDTGQRLTLFMLLLHAMARMLSEVPRLNRFVAGRRLFQRDGAWLSFTVKKSMEPSAPLSVVKRKFEPGETLEEFLSDMTVRISEAKSSKVSYADREMALLLALPRLLLMGLFRIVRWLDFWGLLPGSFIRNDPFFASAFVTNLGSVGGKSAFHHLYEYGNIPIFCTLGRIEEEVVARNGVPMVRTIARLKFSYDERIEDGFNAIRALTGLKEKLEDPRRLVTGRQGS
ncbi:MAG: 2-oxo acid dehydrogenase subunit E2 [Deltaproteobacteria bacterium]|nr:2-oxo acid dehydrogenase subunit E2 [Deltaproteobacteria bacterium]